MPINISKNLNKSEYYRLTWFFVNFKQLQFFILLYLFFIQYYILKKKFILIKSNFFLVGKNQIVLELIKYLFYDINI